MPSVESPLDVTPPTTATAPRDAPRDAPREPRPRILTIWERGRHPGRLVVRVAMLATLALVAGSLVLGDQLGLLFDAGFVVLCVSIALWVRPRDFFTVGVLPPILLAAVMGTLTVLDRRAIAQAGDSPIQGVVSGLAHHALWLVVGYALTLAVLAVRQVALRHEGRLPLRR